MPQTKLHGRKIFDASGSGIFSPLGDEMSRLDPADAKEGNVLMSTSLSVFHFGMSQNEARDYFDEVESHPSLAASEMNWGSHSMSWFRSISSCSWSDIFFRKA